MFIIKTMNKTATTGLNRLPADTYTIGDNVENEDGILVRSAKLHEYEFPRQSAGYRSGGGRGE